MKNRGRDAHALAQASRSPKPPLLGRRPRDGHNLALRFLLAAIDDALDGRRNRLRAERLQADLVGLQNDPASGVDGGLVRRPLEARIEQRAKSDDVGSQRLSGS